MFQLTEEEKVEVVANCDHLARLYTRAPVWAVADPCVRFLKKLWGFREHEMSKGMARRPSVIPTGRIESRIFLLHGQKVMLSMHLAELYGVEPRALVQAVKRNIERFPGDFMFQLSETELKT